MLPTHADALPGSWNFRDIVATLLADGAAVVVHDANELEAFVRRCLDEPQFAHSLGAPAQALVKTQLGATARTTALLESLSPQRSASAAA